MLVIRFFGSEPDGIIDMLLQPKSIEMDNDIAEQQVNNDIQAKTKQQMQDQLSSPPSEVLKTYKFSNFKNCELKVKLSDFISSICTMSMGIYIK